MWFINLIYLPNVVSKDIIKRKMYFMDFYILYFIVCVCVCICVSCLLEKANMIKIKINNNIRGRIFIIGIEEFFCCCCFVCKLELCWYSDIYDIHFNSLFPSLLFPLWKLLPKSHKKKEYTEILQINKELRAHNLPPFLHRIWNTDIIAIGYRIKNCIA